MDSPNDSNASSNTTLIWSPKTPPMTTKSEEDDPQESHHDVEMPHLQLPNLQRPIDNMDVEMPTLQPATQNLPIDLTSNLLNQSTATTSSLSDHSGDPMDLSVKAKSTSSENLETFRKEDTLRKEARAVLQLVDTTLSEQCNRLGNLLDAFNNVPVPPPMPCNKTPVPLSLPCSNVSVPSTVPVPHPMPCNNILVPPPCNTEPIPSTVSGNNEVTPPSQSCNTVPSSSICTKESTLTKIDLQNCLTTNITRLKRKLWLQNLLQLRDSFGKGIMFYNGKVDWQLTISSEEEPEQEVKSTSDTIDTPASPDSPPPVTSESTKNKPGLATKKDESKSIATKLNFTETTVSNIKSESSKTTDPRSNLNSQELEKANETQGDETNTIISDSTDSKESTVNQSSQATTDCSQSIFKKDSRQFKYKVSLPSTSKRKNAADFFASDPDSSFDSSDQDSSFSLEKDQSKKTYDQVGRGIKKLRLDENQPPEQRCTNPETKQEEHDVNYKLLMLKMESEACENENISSRKCRVCGEVERNLKRHTIFEHLTDVWWGVIGDATCWRCQQYHILPDIRFCDGFYVPQRDLRSLVMRHKEFFSIIKDDLECVTDADLIGLVIREGICNSSVSPFTSAEINFMRDIDRATGLSTNHLYSALYPIRLTELLHW